MVVVYDIEVLRNLFLYLDYNLDTEEFSQFEISDFVNELPALLKHLDKIKAQIGFNNLAYDSQVIQHMRKNAKTLLRLDAEDIYTFLHDYSDSLIQNKEERRWLDYSEKSLPIIQLDLFKIWHYDNPARKCSLKWLQYSMDWDNIEDMPISHLDRVKTEEIRESIKYYCKNDVLSTLQFYKITQGITEHPEYAGKDKIKFRKDITRKLGIQCRNFNDVKIGDEINKQNYLRATGKRWFDIKNLRTKRPKFTFGDCYPSYIEFQTEELQGFFERLKDIFIDVMSDQKFTVNFDGVQYTMAKGGLHSKDKPRKIEPAAHEILRDADVGSMYPNAILKRGLYPQHLGKEWLEGYKALIQERLECKKKYKDTKDPAYQSIVEALKLALNGGSFGKTGETTSWQYDIFITFAVTVGCQIDLLMLIESLVLAGIRVMSANTDGIVCLFDKDKEDVYNKVCNDWEKKVGNYDVEKDQGILEYNDYVLMAQMAVNSYIAVKKNGEAKYKNQFMIDHELHKNKSFKIIPLALDAYYRKDINPVKFIKEHQNIFDFCAGARVNDKWYWEIRGVENDEYVKHRLLKTNRFFISNSGYKLIKINKEDDREIQKNSGKWMCTIYNRHLPRSIEEYNINYDFYIEATYKIISKIQPDVSATSNQMALFY